MDGRRSSAHHWCPNSHNRLWGKDMDKGSSSNSSPVSGSTGEVKGQKLPLYRTEAEFKAHRLNLREQSMLEGVQAYLDRQQRHCCKQFKTSTAKVQNHFLRRLSVAVDSAHHSPPLQTLSPAITVTSSLRHASAPFRRASDIPSPSHYHAAADDDIWPAGLPHGTLRQRRQTYGGPVSTLPCPPSTLGGVESKGIPDCLVCGQLAKFPHNRNCQGTESIVHAQREAEWGQLQNHHKKGIFNSGEHVYLLNDRGPESERSRQVSDITGKVEAPASASWNRRGTRGEVPVISVQDTEYASCQTTSSPPACGVKIPEKGTVSPCRVNVLDNGTIDPCHVSVQNKGIVSQCHIFVPVTKTASPCHASAPDKAKIPHVPESSDASQITGCSRHPSLAAMATYPDCKDAGSKDLSRTEDKESYVFHSDSELVSDFSAGVNVEHLENLRRNSVNVRLHDVSPPQRKTSLFPNMTSSSKARMMSSVHSAPDRMRTPSEPFAALNKANGMLSKLTVSSTPATAATSASRATMPLDCSFVNQDSPTTSSRRTSATSARQKSATSPRQKPATSSRHNSATSPRQKTATSSRHNSATSPRYISATSPRHTSPSSAGHTLYDEVILNEVIQPHARDCPAREGESLRRTSTTLEDNVRASSVTVCTSLPKFPDSALQTRPHTSSTCFRQKDGNSRNSSSVCPESGHKTTSGGASERVGMTSGSVSDKCKMTSGSVSDKSKVAPGSVADKCKMTSRNASGRVRMTSGSMSGRVMTTSGSVSDKCKMASGSVSDKCKMASGSVADKSKVAPGSVSDKCKMTSRNASGRVRMTSGSMSGRGRATSGSVSGREGKAPLGSSSSRPLQGKVAQFLQQQTEFNRRFPLKNHEVKTLECVRSDLVYLSREHWSRQQRSNLGKEKRRMIAEVLNVLGLTELDIESSR